MRQIETTKAPVPAAKPTLDGQACAVCGARWWWPGGPPGAEWLCAFCHPPRSATPWFWARRHGGDPTGRGLVTGSK